VRHLCRAVCDVLDVCRAELLAAAGDGGAGSNRGRQSTFHSPGY
jgi:hypothetical protein